MRSQWLTITILAMGLSVALSLGATAIGQPVDLFRISPTRFDFGNVGLNSTAATQSAIITNVSSVPQTISGAGGFAGVFGGTQNCQGATLAPGGSCQFNYRFSPAEIGAITGGTSGTINGQPFEFTFEGQGIETFRISPTEFDFGSIAVGTTSPTQSAIITNVSNTAQTISGAGGFAGVFGGTQNCQGATLGPGGSCQFNYRFSPVAPGPVTGSTAGTINGQPFSLTFEGNTNTGETFLISPTRFDFGNVPLNASSATQSATITNVSDFPQTIAGSGGFAGAFGGTQNCQGATLGPGGSCQFNYRFTPEELGQVEGSTSGDINGQPFAFTFEGNGVETFLITPTGFDFGNVQVGTTSATQSAIITNVSNVPQTISGAGGFAGVFGGTQNCQGATLAPGGSCQFNYRFSPAEIGAITGGTSGTINGQPFELMFEGNGFVPLAGDYNSNGRVDAADYVVWRNFFGAPPGTLPNDVDGGVIGLAQYATWRSHFGMTAAASPNLVPEPTTAALWGACAPVLVRHRRRSARSC